MIVYLILLSLSSGALCSFGVLLEATIGSGDGVPRTVVATGERTRRFASDVCSTFWFSHCAFFLFAQVSALITILMGVN